jgi:hypothetical protein
MAIGDGQTPQEEAADWATWLDRFEEHVLPVFGRRGYSKDTAASIYFRSLPHVPFYDECDDHEENDE